MSSSPHVNAGTCREDRFSDEFNVRFPNFSYTDCDLEILFLDSTVFYDTHHVM